MLEQLEKVSFYLFVFFLPFSLKKVIFTFGSFFSGYQAMFVYLADILLFLVLVFWLRRLILKKTSQSLEGKDYLFLLFVLLAVVSSAFGFYPALCLSKTLRLFLVFLLYIYLKNNLGFLKVSRIIGFVLASGSFQALVATLQFFKQASLGLHFFGEPVVSPLVLGVAKFSVRGVKFIRPPGLLPHANILAAYLFLSIGALSYFWLRKNNSKHLGLKRIFLRDIFLSSLVFLLLLSLLLTFSRSGWVVFIFFFSVLSLALVAFRKFKKYHSKVLALFLLSLLIILSLSFIFKDFLFVRTHFDLKEKAISLRLVYQRMSLGLIKSHPIFGVGFSNYLSYLSRNNLWQKYGLKFTYLFQPVHNIYLLVASELGLVGLLLFLSFLFLTLKGSVRKLLASENSLAVLIFFLVELGFLIWGLSDHFFFDLAQGSYLFWLNTGILAGLSKG